MSIIPLTYEQQYTDIGAKGESGIFTIRNIKLFLTWLLFWQDSSVDGSIFQFYTWTGRFHSVRPIEVLVILLGIVLLVERFIERDFHLARSYFTAPLLFILSGLFISWARGIYFLQNYSIAYEVHEAFILPIVFFLVVNLYRDSKDSRILFVLLITATVPKAIEGMYIRFYSTDPSVGWGVLQMWRDGYLLGFGIAALVLVLHYRGQTYRWLQKLMVAASPFLFFTLIVSYRRTFFVALFVSSMAMFLTLDKQRRPRHRLLMSGLLAGIIIAVLSSDPLGFIGRLAGIVAPGEEGSAYIRLMELPNVLMNIAHNPVFGTPIGMEWHQYFRMPIFANFTTLGVHNTYLYWPLRTGILGTVGFVWLLVRMWKSALLNFRLSRSEEQWFFGQIAIHIIIIYQVSCFFGMMYADGVTSLLAVVLVAFQLQSMELGKMRNYRNVNFLESWKGKQIVLRQH